MHTPVTIRLNTLLLLLLVLMGAVIIAMLAARAEGGPLDPPDPPAATMRTLGEIEPRTPISSIPYTITAPGSYYLTQNVTLSSPANGIVIQANNVVLDLNGFTVDGANIGGKGIYATSGTVDVTIRNGTVVRFTGYGFDAQNGAILENVHANHNQVGIVVRGTVRGCSANSNGFSGVNANYSTVDDCFAQENPTGFELYASTLSHCSSLGNQTGIFMRGASLVEGCVVLYGTTGILVAGASKDEGGSMVRSNTVQSTGGDGIYVPGWNSYVEGNTVTNAGASQPGSGIYATGQRNRIDSNHVNDSSAYGIIVNLGSGNLVVRNWADANNVDYFVGPGNDAAPVQQPATATSPWANLTH